MTVVSPLQLTRLDNMTSAVEESIQLYLKYCKTEEEKQEIEKLSKNEKFNLFGKRMEFGTAGNDLKKSCFFRLLSL